jgi:cyanophycinase
MALIESPAPAGRAVSWSVAMKAPGTSGPLVVIGGAEDRAGEARILRAFVQLAGGGKGRVVVVTVASEDAAAVGAEYVGAFRRLGSKDVLTLDIATRKQAGDAGALDVLERATGVFFTGGDQMRITNLLGGTPADQLLHRRHEAGLALGGTSAGAAMMSGTMIVRGASQASPRAGIVQVGPGMDFLHGVIIDQHFARRGRAGRLLAALARYPHLLGVGIDEDTALIARGDRFTVLGEGAVMVYDLGHVSFNNALELHETQHMTIGDIRLHVLADGAGFDLTGRTPLPPQNAPDALSPDG